MKRSTLAILIGAAAGALSSLSARRNQDPTPFVPQARKGSIMDRKLTIYSQDARLVESNLDLGVGGIPPELERLAKLVNEAYTKNGDREQLARLLNFPANVPPRDMAHLVQTDASENRESGPGIVTPGMPPVQPPVATPSSAQGTTAPGSPVTPPPTPANPTPPNPQGPTQPVGFVPPPPGSVPPPPPSSTIPPPPPSAPMGSTSIAPPPGTPGT
jgi:hypothetical protein